MRGNTQRLEKVEGVSHMDIWKRISLLARESSNAKMGVYLAMKWKGSHEVGGE